MIAFLIMSLHRTPSTWLFLLLLISFVSTSHGGSQADWSKWTQKRRDQYSKKLATPSIAHFIYLSKLKESAFVDLQRRPRFVRKPCQTCMLKVAWASQNEVRVQDPKSSREMTFKVGKSENVPWNNKLFFSTYEVDSLNRLRVFIHDLSDPNLAEKRKRHFMPYNPKSIYEAEWTWLSSPKPIKMQRSDGSSEEMSALAELQFSEGGEMHTLSVYDYGEKEENMRQQNSLLLLFRDLSNGRQTYGAGRFLSLQLGKQVGDLRTGEKISLDFNYSYNPPCSVSQGFHCPLPQDFMNLNIQAGEKYNKIQ